MYPEAAELLWAEYHLKTQNFPSAIKSIEKAKVLFGIELVNGNNIKAGEFEPFEVIEALGLDINIYKAAYPPTYKNLQVLQQKYLRLLSFTNQERWLYK